MDMSEDGVPEDILNGTDRDSNLLPSGAKKNANLPDDLQKKLEDYNRNFESLDRALGSASLLTDETATDMKIEKTRDMLVQALPIAVQTVMEIANYSLSDSIRLKAAMYIIDRTMGKEVVEPEDAATKLFKRLSSQPQEGGN